jgi:Protein of unknown function (DUF3592)
MKALKIVGVVIGILLLLTGGGLAVGSALANKGQAAFADGLTKSGYAGPVDGKVQSVTQGEPVIVTVGYTDNQGKNQVGQGAFAGGRPPQVGETVPTYYSTRDPSQVVVTSLPGLGDLSTVADVLRTAAIVCLIVGSLVLLAGIIGLALGKKRPAALGPGQTYPTGQPQQPVAGYPTQPNPPQQSPVQPYLPQPPPGPGYPSQQPSGHPNPPPQEPSQPNPPQQYPSQPNPPQQYPRER